MNQKQALTKARKIWGKGAAIRDNGQPLILANGAKLGERYAVGRTMFGMFFSVEGEGESWGAAFKNYEEKKKAESERLAKPRDNKQY